MELLDFYFKSNNPVNTVIEVFNPLNSFTHALNTSYQNPALPNMLYYPYPRWETPNGTPTRAENLAWDKAGNLIYAFNNGTYCASIECAQYPYRSVLEALKTQKIKIHLIRMASTTQAQLVENVTWFEFKPLTKIYKENVYNITISPFNVIPNLNDWKQDLIIDGASGLKFELLPNEVLAWNVHFEFIN